ncbi:hypothetical protein PBRA_002855 [Plasmodiophora brassicae]|uniref:Uncharacterized protein n=1 Tax=Plasmodiophora brassicae TaxID=37360 RepID=A0A0G4J687_PLABS|nr:hypothetical protein PBRA_002855 [Plasmodiophora brassicae]
MWGARLMTRRGPNGSPGACWLRSSASTMASGVEKNIDKWFLIEDFGSPVEGTCLLPTKTLSRDPAHSHTVETFLTRNPTVTAIIDLSNETDNYEVAGRFSSVAHLKMSFESKVIPSRQHVADFIRLVQDNMPLDTDNGLIAVHCHYGFNRTGFLICSFLCEVLGLSPDEAIDRFRRARPPGIKHEHFIRELYNRYSRKEPPSDSPIS